MATRTNQFRLYDLRVPQDTGLELMFGCSEPENVSRYLRPDWKPESWTVASGNMQDNKIHIWYVLYYNIYLIVEPIRLTITFLWHIRDLRYREITSGGPCYSWDGHSKSDWTLVTPVS
jgi:hypothetical protein